MANLRYPSGNPRLNQQSLSNLAQAARDNQLSQGEWVARFERNVAGFIGVEHAVACNNGTAALHLALMALGIGYGDAVIVPATTFVATANAVAYTGATPIIVDIDAETWTLDPNEVEKAIQQFAHLNIKAVVAVHLYGVPCDMHALNALCRQHGLYLIEDAAEALGASYDGIRVGALADVACFSFYANKTLTTGEGGMVTTNDETVAANARLLRGQGQNGERYWHTVIGYNYRMTDLQAAVGCGQLDSIHVTLAERALIYQAYAENGLDTQSLPDKAVHGHWAFATLLEYNANEIQGICLERGLELRPVFYPLTHLPPYRNAPQLPVPNAERVSKFGAVLPVYPSLTIDDVLTICDILEDAVNVKSYYASHP